MAAPAARTSDSCNDPLSSSPWIPSGTPPETPGPGTGGPEGPSPRIPEDDDECTVFSPCNGYLLTECHGGGTVIETTNDLSTYVGKVVKVNGICYSVASSTAIVNPQDVAIESSNNTCDDCNPLVSCTCPGGLSSSYLVSLNGDFSNCTGASEVNLTFPVTVTETSPGSCTWVFYDDPGDTTRNGVELDLIDAEGEAKPDGTCNPTGDSYGSGVCVWKCRVINNSQVSAWIGYRERGSTPIGGYTAAAWTHSNCSGSDCNTPPIAGLSVS